MGVALLDSNVIVGFLYGDDALHTAADAAVREAASRHSLIVSVVTFAELLIGAKLGHHDEPTVRRFLDEAVAECVVIDEAVAESAAELRAADRALRMPDALIAATASAHADLLLTADRRMAKLPGVACEVVYVV